MIIILIQRSLFRVSSCVMSVLKPDEKNGFERA